MISEAMGESQEGHWRRTGKAISEGFLEKETIEENSEDENKLHKARRKESGINFQMA